MRRLQSARGSLARGDVVWLDMPQTLSFAGPDRKKRPAVVLSREVSFAVDAAGRCAEDVWILVADGTSKDYLVQGRPHVPFRISSGQNKTTHVFLDSIRSVGIRGQEAVCIRRLDEDEMSAVLEGLDKVLQPEQRFYLSRLFSRQAAFMPGQIVQVHVPTAVLPDFEALILLRRGRFVLPDDSGQEERTRFAPYLVVSFNGAADLRTLRGVRWDDIRVVALQGNSFSGDTGRRVGAQTIEILLNGLRGRVGLPPVLYKEPSFMHRLALALPVLRLPTLGR